MPAVIPDTIPVVAPTVATDALPLTHDPLVAASDRVVAVPWHNAETPDMAEIPVLTVTIFVAIHPALL